MVDAAEKMDDGPIELAIIEAILEANASAHKRKIAEQVAIHFATEAMCNRLMARQQVLENLMRSDDGEELRSAAVKKTRASPHAAGKELSARTRGSVRRNSPSPKPSVVRQPPDAPKARKTRQYARELATLQAQIMQLRSKLQTGPNPDIND